MKKIIYFFLICVFAICNCSFFQIAFADTGTANVQYSPDIIDDSESMSSTTTSSLENSSTMNSSESMSSTTTSSLENSSTMNSSESMSSTTTSSLENSFTINNSEPLFPLTGSSRNILLIVIGMFICVVGVVLWKISNFKRNNNQ